MSIPAWQVITWAPCRVQLKDWRVISGRLRHLGTSVYVDDRGGVSPHGQVLWGAEHGDRMLGIAWDWGQVVPGVVAMSDPMALLSNIIFLDDEDEPLPESSRTLPLHRAIYRLDWQRAVLTLHHRGARAADAETAREHAAKRVAGAALRVTT